MNEIKQNTLKFSENTLGRIINDEEFIRIYENIRFKDKITNDFTSLSDHNKINCLIHAFFIIKTEKGNLFNNFIELENDTKNIELDNLRLAKEVKDKENQIKELSCIIEKLELEIEGNRMRHIDISPDIYKPQDKNTYQDTLISEIENPFFNNLMNFEITRKYSKKDFKINKFLNNTNNHKTCTNSTMKNNTGEKGRKETELIPFPNTSNQNIIIERNINPLINDLNVDFINFQIKKNLNKNDENFIADYILKSNKENENEKVEFECNNASEYNNKLKSYFNSQINQSVSVYDSVYESYDNKYNIGEYNSSTYQTISSTNKNQTYI